MSTNDLKKICISIGDFNGIGPEVVIKSVLNQDHTKLATLILGSPKIINHYLSILNLNLDFQIIHSVDEIETGGVYVLNPEIDKDLLIEAGLLSAEAGLHAMKAIEMGIHLCRDGLCDALVTAPISKDAINKAGYSVPGHTEFLAEQTQTGDVLMMLVNDGLRVALVSAHIPLSDVTSWVNKSSIQKKARLLDASLRNDFNIENPKIAAFGLNPHAGDGGILGMEEVDIITPAISELQNEGIHIEGPFPADGFFGARQQTHYDGILAMYHDQGLIPFKTLSFGNGVNFTAGLPIIRTSPDHGTAYALAGKGIADPSSFNAAFDLAMSMIGHQNG